VDLLSSYYFQVGDQIKEDEMGGERSTHGGDAKYLRYFVGTPEGKRNLGKLRRRGKDKIIMDLKTWREDNSQPTKHIKDRELRQQLSN
jgi:hypothetical protein